MALDIGTLVAKIKVDDGDFDKKTDSWSTKGAAIGSAFGNIAADAVSQVTNMLSDFVGEAMEASDATAKFEKTLSFAGLDTSAIDKLRKSTQAYADETVYNLSDIQSITATLAANGVEGYDSLAMALGNLNAVAGGNAETFGRVGSVLTQTAGQGKLTTENWNQLTDAIPGASKKLMDALLNAGAYTGNFREAMEKGEITAEEFNAAIQQVGTDPVAVEAAKSVETFEGSAGNLAAAIQSKLVAALDMIKPIITDVTNGFAEFIANIESWTPVIAGVGAIILAVMAPAIWAAVTATWAWTAALLANPITWIILAIGLLVAGIVWLIMNWDTAVAWISEVWGGFIGWITGVIEGFVAWWNEMWAGFASWIGEVWVGFTTWISEVWNGFISWIVGVGEGFLGWWNGIWAAVGQWISDVWNGFIGFIQSVWQGYVSWIMGIVSGVVNWWNSTWSAVGAFISGVWSGFVAAITAIWNGYVSWIMSVVNGFVSGWNSTWQRVGQIIQDVWNNVVSFFQGIPGAINNLLSGAGQWLYNIGRDIIQGLWNGLKSIWKSVENWFNDTFGGIIDTVAGLFGIASPSRVFREFGQFIGMGLIEGLEEFEDPIDAEFRRMTDVPPIDVPPPSGSDGDGGDSGGGDHWHYHAAPNASFDAQEEFFAAMGSPRVKD
ncbi:tape measure protein [Microbacterium phage Johann]|uniref:Tape measure protein n=2 Tax=Goodmanvirus goodman TaxID=2734238 RepID=A0A3G3LZY1_9CAUD|nr:tail length tape measure protein [Microbacterium phage Goodman]AYQ99476.1 tape measure protein [Microbacterium phage Goodman]AYQ99644.1 tape measure protein [Microbacterium phage Johann]